jgi:outer membrane immunogenic protein
VLAAAAAAAALVSVPAQAGILDPAPAYPTRFSDTALMYDWTGLYVGLNAGGSFGRVHWKSDPDSVSGNVSTSSAVVGGTIGYHLYMLRSILGIPDESITRNPYQSRQVRRVQDFHA